MTSPTATRAPFVDAPPLLEPVADLEHILRLKVGSEDQVAPTVEVGIGTQLHGLAFDEDVRLEERVPADADLLHPADAGVVQRDVPLARPAGVQLGLSGGEASVHAGTVPLASDVESARLIEELTAGVSRRQGQRRLLAAGLSEPRWRRAPEAETRIRRLLEEGVPTDWVAEDVGEKYNTIRAFARRAGIDTNTGWKAIRLSIFKTPALRALHEEFAP